MRLQINAEKIQLYAQIKFMIMDGFFLLQYNPLHRKLSCSWSSYNVVLCISGSSECINLNVKAKQMQLKSIEEGLNFKS